MLLASHQRGVVKKEQPYDVCNSYVWTRTKMDELRPAVRLWLRTAELQGERLFGIGLTNRQK